MSGLYPEHEKQSRVVERSQAIGEFLDWLPSKEIALARWVGSELTPERPNIIKLLAEFFDIDLDKIEAEKRAMLDEIRHANGSSRE